MWCCEYSPTLPSTVWPRLLLMVRANAGLRGSCRRCHQRRACINHVSGICSERQLQRAAIAASGICSERHRRLLLLSCPLFAGLGGMLQCCTLLVMLQLSSVSGRGWPSHHLLSPGPVHAPPSSSSCCRRGRQGPTLPRVAIPVEFLCH